MGEFTSQDLELGSLLGNWKMGVWSESCPVASKYVGTCWNLLGRQLRFRLQPWPQKNDAFWTPQWTKATRSSGSQVRSVRLTLKAAAWTPDGPSETASQLPFIGSGIVQSCNTLRSSWKATRNPKSDWAFIYIYGQFLKNLAMPDTKEQYSVAAMEHGRHSAL